MFRRPKSRERVCDDRCRAGLGSGYGHMVPRVLDSTDLIRGAPRVAAVRVAGIAWRTQQVCRGVLQCGY